VSTAAVRPQIHELRNNIDYTIISIWRPCTCARNRLSASCHTTGSIVSALNISKTPNSSERTSGRQSFRRKAFLNMRPPHVFILCSAIAVQANTIVPAQGAEPVVPAEEREPRTTHVRHVVPGNSTAIPAHSTADLTNVTGKTLWFSLALRQNLSLTVSEKKASRQLLLRRLPGQVSGPSLTWALSLSQ
jgi:hypothetical protein